MNKASMHKIGEMSVSLKRSHMEQKHKENIADTMGMGCIGNFDEPRYAALLRL
jgi:hypothetical protein